MGRIVAHVLEFISANKYGYREHDIQGAQREIKISMSAEPRKTGDQGADASQSQEARLKRRAAAAEQFDQRFQRRDGATIVNSLADGLNSLRDLLYTRVHGDVEQRVGLDSMMVSTAALKNPELGRNEIEFYEIAEATATMVDREYLDGDKAWCLAWLGRLRLGEEYDTPVAATRLSSYLARPTDDRRRMFAQILERSLPEAAHAPLVIYRLFPLAVSAATSLAFGDHIAAEAARKQQIVVLPGIGDCPHCHGRVLSNEEKCPQCSNPFWNYDWLTSD